jgi:hypothetical protein
MIRTLGWSVSGPIASLLQCSLVVTDNRPHSPEKASVCRQAMVGRCTSQVDRWVQCTGSAVRCGRRNDGGVGVGPSHARAQLEGSALFVAFR